MLNHLRALVLLCKKLVKACYKFDPIYRFSNFLVNICLEECIHLKTRSFCMKFFMSDEEKHGHHFDLPFFFKISKQLLAPRAMGLSTECVQLVSCKPEASRELALRPPKA